MFLLRERNGIFDNGERAQGNRYSELALNMKICILSTSEKRGGAAVAAGRLMKALQSSGVNVKMVVRDKQTLDENVISVNTSWIKRKINTVRFIWERVVIWKTNCFHRQNLFTISIASTGTDISKLREVQEADIIHLHWINQGLLSLADIKKLTGLGKPMLWTMHDMWPCTGICHHARECVKYQSECQRCPFLRYPGVDDLSSKVFKKKQQLNYGQITFVTCSKWLEDQAHKSVLLKKSKLRSIPNPLDTSLFIPSDTENARKQFNLPLGKQLLLFGAAKISDSRKGFEYFFQAMESFAREYPNMNDKLELVFLGGSDIDLPNSILYKANFVGYLTENADIVNLYNAVNLFVLPSLEENLPNMIMESMACGTPVVGFNAGGIPEMIDHKANGYVANYKDSEDLMRGIYWALFEADYQSLCNNARRKVIENYSEEVVATKYMELYGQQLEEK